MEQERPTVELKFEIRDTGALYIDASATLDCRVVVEDVIHREDDRFLEYYTATAPAAEVLAHARSRDGVLSARTVRADDDECLLEVVNEREDSVRRALATTHAVVKRMVAEDGIGVAVVEVPGHADATEVVQTVRDRYEGATLLSKWHRDDADLVAVTGAVGTERYLSALTAKQRDAVRAAVRGGYLAWPRRSSASDCAAALGVSQPTFSQHLYRGLEVLLMDLFDITEDERDSVPASH